jgi:hypothetical protein
MSLNSIRICWRCFWWPLLRRVKAWWRFRQREIDRRVLFPSIYNQTDDEAKATRAIAAHICIDPAWAYSSEWRDEVTPEMWDRLMEICYSGDSQTWITGHD